MLVILKINGKEIFVESDKMHATWVEKCLAYGMRRLPNDTYSGEKGEIKYDLVRALTQDMQSGEAAPVKVQGAGRAPSDPIGSLAGKNAKADLTAMFRSVTGATKAIDFAGHEKVAPFFTTVRSATGVIESAVWNEVTVKAWMVKQAESGKRDYLADAKVTIESVADVESDLDF